MTRYAADTSVSVEKSRGEIEAILRRYKADAFGYMQEGSVAAIMFRIEARQIKMVLRLPNPAADEFVFAVMGARGKQRRAPDAALRAWEQACRQRWRALALVIKAKLEAVSAGITTVEDEFLAHILLPDRSTVGEWIKPQIVEAYRVGAMPKHLMLEGPRE